LSETESLRINAKSDKTFKRNFECIEEVNKFLSLGIVMASNGVAEEDVKI